MAVAAPMLVINSGSSSIKFAVIEDGRKLLGGGVSEISGDARLELAGECAAIEAQSHSEALAAIFSTLEAQSFDVGVIHMVAHRVVHGGELFQKPLRLDTARIIVRLRTLDTLAPLHNPHALAAIEAIARAHPKLTQVAVFDTAFHATIPNIYRRYALPDTPVTEGILRYGFHGISYSSIVERLRDEKRLPERLLALHLGNGASVCAIRNGHSLATSMGYSPLEGLTMGTRCGSIDGNAVLEIARRVGIEEASRLLNHQSGLLGLAGQSDMRLLSASDTAEAAFARAFFIGQLVLASGAMIAAMGGVDMIVFTGGIGEHDSGIRAELLGGLACTGVVPDPAANADNLETVSAPGSAVAVHVFKAEEELMIARLAAQAVSAQ